LQNYYKLTEYSYLKKKIICQALFTLVRHSSPLHLSSLSLLRSRKQPPPPPTQPIRLQSPLGASFSIMFFIFKIYVCIFIYLTEILVQREKFDFNNSIKKIYNRTRWNRCSSTQLEERRNQPILLWVEHLVWSGLLCCLFKERCACKFVKLILISLLFRVDDNMKYSLLMLVFFVFFQD